MREANIDKVATRQTWNNGVKPDKKNNQPVLDAPNFYDRNPKETASLCVFLSAPSPNIDQ